MSDIRDPKRDQPLPKPGNQNVTDAVIADLRERTEHGTKKYGRPLETNNGRDAALDAYQEGLDMVCYLKQAVLENAESGPGLFRLAGTNEAFSYLVQADVSEAKINEFGGFEVVIKPGEISVIHEMRKAIAELDKKISDQAKEIESWRELDRFNQAAIDVAKHHSDRAHIAIASLQEIAAHREKEIVDLKGEIKRLEIRIEKTDWCLAAEKASSTRIIMELHENAKA